MKFHVGQRVRKVAYRRKADIDGPCIHAPIGSIGVILGKSNPREWLVEFDGRIVRAATYQLEPIDDRPEAGSWDEICALTRGWRPGVEVHS